MMTNANTEPGRRADGYTAPTEEGLRPSWKAVYTIADRPGGRKHWLRVGTAFTNRDQSLNVRLDAMPVNGLLHIREATPREVPPPGRSDGGDELGPEWGNA